MKDSLTEIVVGTILALLVITVTVSAILLVESIWKELKNEEFQCKRFKDKHKKMLTGINGNNISSRNFIRLFVTKQKVWKSKS